MRGGYYLMNKEHGQPCMVSKSMFSDGSPRNPLQTLQSKPQGLGTMAWLTFKGCIAPLSSIGASILRIGFWVMLKHNYNYKKEPPK